MDLFNFNTFLFASKWVFIGLIYLALFIVVIAVRREMSLRLGGEGPASSAAVGYLKVIEAGKDPNLQYGEMIALGPEASVGAEPDNEIVLGDPYVSGHHLELRWDGIDWWVEDLGSKNGTSINGVRCPALKPQKVPDGARLAVGDMVFVLEE